MSIIRKPLLGELLDYGDPLTRGLVGLWFINEGSGNVTYDLSGNGNDFALQSDAHFGAGQFGSCLKFYGTDDHAILTTPSIFPINASGQFRNGTICLWFKCNEIAAAQGIFSFGASTVEGSPTVLIAKNGADFRIFAKDRSAYFYTEAGFLVAGQWYFVVLVSDGTNYITYIDGVHKDTSVDGVGVLGVFTNTYLGTGFNAQFNGDIDVPFIYNRALTDKEISDLYEDPFRFVSSRKRLVFLGDEGAVASTPDGIIRRRTYRPARQKPLLGELLDHGNPLTKNLVGCYFFNEKAGNKAYDIIGNKNTGTFISSVSHVPGGLYFAGDDDYIDVGNKYGFTTENFTIICKFRHDDAGPDMLFCNGIGSQYGIILQIGNAAKYFVVLSQGGASQNIVSQDNVYTVGEDAIVAFTRSGEDGKIYHNGKEISSYATQDPLIDPVTPGDTTRFGININGLAFDFTGNMYWMLIYERALNAQEVYQVSTNPYSLVKRHRLIGITGETSPAGVDIDAAGQAAITIASLAGFRRLNRPGAGEAGITTSSLAGFRRLDRPGVAAAAITTSSLAGMRWSMGGAASIVTASTAGFLRLNRPGAGVANINIASAAGMRRLDIPGAAQANIITKTFAGATGGTGVAVLEEIFRYRRLRDAGVFPRKTLKGVF